MDDLGVKPIIFGNTHIYLPWLVDFYGKCRELYQSHGYHGWAMGYEMALNIR